MAIRGEIWVKRSRKHLDRVRKTLIKAIPFDTEIIAQIESICSLFENPTYLIKQANCRAAFCIRHLSATIDLGIRIKRSSASV